MGPISVQPQKPKDVLIIRAPSIKLYLVRLERLLLLLLLLIVESIFQGFDRLSIIRHKSFFLISSDDILLRLSCDIIN